MQLGELRGLQGSNLILFGAFEVRTASVVGNITVRGVVIIFFLANQILELAVGQPNVDSALW